MSTQGENLCECGLIIRVSELPLNGNQGAKDGGECPPASNTQVKEEKRTMKDKISCSLFPQSNCLTMKPDGELSKLVVVERYSSGVTKAHILLNRKKLKKLIKLAKAERRRLKRSY